MQRWAHQRWARNNVHARRPALVNLRSLPPSELVKLLEGLRDGCIKGGAGSFQLGALNMPRCPTRHTQPAPVLVLNNCYKSSEELHSMLLRKRGAALVRPWSMLSRHAAAPSALSTHPVHCSAQLRRMPRLLRRPRVAAAPSSTTCSAAMSRF